jgi:N-ethylmaleimide reductase
LAPSAINPNFFAFTLDGKKDTVTPKEMSLEEIRDTILDFKRAAQNAVEAGFDGVEVHGANAYLIDQFITASANTRNDRYGGTVENRSRFLLEILDELTATIGAEKVGLRLSPHHHGVAGIELDGETQRTFDHIIGKLNDYNLAYLHLTDALWTPSNGQPPHDQVLASTRKYRNSYKGNIIINKGFDRQLGEEVLEEGIADMVAYGSPFIANPDLVDRFKKDLPLASPDPNTFYQGGEKGYIDYPIYQ